uniref:Transporter n=1 Tax=Ascaris suum TaxID=6253 RepID=F1KZU3_ASCSU
MDHHNAEPITGVDVPVVGSDKRLSSATSVGNLDAEKVLSAFGKFGKYQMMAYILLNSVAVLYSSQMMIMGFISIAPKFECNIQQPEEGPQWQYTIIDRCYVADSNNWTIACNDIPNASFNFNETSPRSTLNSEFNLVCRDEHWAQHASSLFMLGGMIVTPFLTQLSDLHGRRYTFLIPLWTAVAAALACSIAPTYGLFLFFRFVAGVGTTGYSTIGWVLSCESVSVEFRSLIPLVGTFTWVAGIMMVGALRIFIGNWRWLYFAISVPGLLTISYYWLLPESLHWMITHNRSKGISRYIKASSRFNKIRVSLPECKSTAIKPIEEKSRTFLDMIKSKAIVFHLIVHCLIIMIMNATYWGLALFSTKLSDDSYTGYFLSGLIEIPAGLLCIPLLVKFGRRTITFWCLALQGISMGAAILYPGPGTIEMIFPVAAKLFNSIVWSSEPLLLAEMSPTSIRNTFYGVVQFFGEIGSVVAPYLELLKEVDERAPQAIVAALSTAAALLVLTAPETKDKPMPEDLDQFDAGCLLKRFACCAKNRSKEAKECNYTEFSAMLPTIHEENTIGLNDVVDGEKKKINEIV